MKRCEVLCLLRQSLRKPLEWRAVADGDAVTAEAERAHWSAACVFTVHALPCAMVANNGEGKVAEVKGALLFGGHYAIDSNLIN